MQNAGRHPVLGLALAGVAAATFVFLLLSDVRMGLAQPPGPRPGSTDTPWTPPTLTARERAERFQPGPPWQGKGKRGIAQQEAEVFTDYPLFWLGGSFAGYNLQAIVRERYTPPAGVPARYAADGVTFIYGDCKIPAGAHACPVPISITVQPACMKRPDLLAEGMKAGPMETARGGAQLQRFRDGHVRLWTGRVTIYVDAPVDQARTGDLVRELRGINTTARAGDHLPGPDFSGCPPLDVPPLREPPPRR
ncbi:MAG: hypothetical protein M3Q65_14435 [Chloroflexota bacterium]|nr:hypothetical protein [Chloroflexota bacterium]